MEQTIVLTSIRDEVAAKHRVTHVVRKSNDGEVCITKPIVTHNHEVGTEMYQSYDEARQIDDAEVLSGVRTLYRGGANRKRILEYIGENTTVQPAMKAVHNLVACLKRETYAFPTIEERIASILGDFASGKGNVSRDYASEKGVVKYIFIQTSHMRTMFENFPEVLFIDATHATNVSNYKCFSFMIQDAVNKGQHVRISAKSQFWIVCDV
ncbi:hypothetical protein PI125_g17826 [Phytophthora idaei]|nr:hypothetical protein PI125_g17826 [Phytophthora idaei]